MLTEQRQMVLVDVWQIMGLSDIMRGSTDADETLGAQEMKAQFGSMRLKTVQGDVARYATDIFRLKAQVLCRHFAPQTLIAMSGIQHTNEGKNPEVVKAAIALLKQGELKDFRINVESDSLAQIDEAAEKKETAEFIESMGVILKEAGPVIQAAPTMLPFIGELMLLAARKQRAGRTVEQALEQALSQTQQMLSQPQGMPPEVQEQIQKAHEEIQKKGEELQAQEQDLFKRETQHEVSRIQFDADQKVAAAEQKARDVEQGARQEVEGQKKQFEQAQQDQALNGASKEVLQQVKELVANHQLAVKTAISDAQTTNKVEQAKNQAAAKEDAGKKAEDKSEQRMAGVMEKVAQMNADLGKQIGELMKVLAAPKKIVRGKDGRAEGVVVNA
jgi:hypothetical protein